METRCKFEPMGIDCDGRTHCQTCGWNPLEKQRRIKKLRELADAGAPLKLRVKIKRLCPAGFIASCDKCGATCELRVTG